MDALSHCLGQCHMALVMVIRSPAADELCIPPRGVPQPLWAHSRAGGCSLTRDEPCVLATLLHPSCSAQSLALGTPCRNSLLECMQAALRSLSCSCMELHFHVAVNAILLSVHVQLFGLGRSPSAHPSHGRRCLLLEDASSSAFSWLLSRQWGFIKATLFGFVVLGMELCFLAQFHAQLGC